MNTSLALARLDEDTTLWPDSESGFGALTTSRGVLPLKVMDVRGKIEGLLAHVVVEQTFVNVFAQPLEATYIFPLPPEAAVTSFRMEVAGRVVRGVLKERGEAREIYEEAIASGQRAAIAEEDRSDVFSMQVGNLLPEEHATLRMTMTFPLSCRDGEVTFRFPLVVAPRYVPGTPLDMPQAGAGIASDTDAVPDASRISPPVLLKGYPNPVQLSLSIEIDAGDIPVGSLRSSLHALLLHEAERRVTVSLRPHERLDRDFILRYRYGGEEIAPSLSLAPDHMCRPHWEQREQGQEGPMSPKDCGTFSLTITPPLMASQRKPRDIAFVLDRSGSMGGWKMVVARNAVSQMIASLHPRDQFQVLAFDHVLEYPEGMGDDVASGVLTRASRRNRLAADVYLSGLEARGGTEMAGPLLKAAELLQNGAEGRERVMVLITDGQIGNEDQILQTLGERCEHLRIFTLGIDTAVNAGFLERLATLGGGGCELVESEARLEEAFARIQRMIETPVLSELRVELEGVALTPDSLAPGRLPDLFSGVPLCISGRYRGSHEGAVVIHAKDAAGNAWKHRVFGQISANPSIPTIWARQHIRKLEDEIASCARYFGEIEPEILSTSLQFGVLSRFTAFVAVDEEKAIDAEGPLHQVVQSVETPDGWQLAEGREPIYTRADEKKEEVAQMQGSTGMRGGRSDDKPEVTRMGGPVDQRAKEVLSTLVPREEKALRMRFDSMPNEAAELPPLEVTREQISQIEKKAKEKLRHPRRKAGRTSSGEANGRGQGRSSRPAPTMKVAPKPAPTNAAFRRKPAFPAPVPVQSANSNRHNMSQAKTQSGLIRKRFHHFSPEDVKGSEITQRTEQYGLGVLLYELLAGQRLFSARGELQQLQEIIKGPDVPLFSEPSLRTLEVVLLRLLQGEPENRFADMQEVIDALRGLQAQFPEADVPFALWLQQNCPEQYDATLQRLRELDKRTDLSAAHYQALHLLREDEGCEMWMAAHIDADGQPEPLLLRRASLHRLAEEEFKQTFMAEGRLQHPGAHCPRSICITPDDRCAQVYDFVSGIDCRALVGVLENADLRMPISYALEVGLQLAEILLAFHLDFPELAYGRIEPESVYFGFDGKVYLRDFGVVPAVARAPVEQKEILG